MSKLAGQVAFVTGADYGIGRAIAIAFARERASVFIVFHSDEEGAAKKEQVASIPWKRAAEPDEVATLAAYLASQDADYVTGATFVIDGGLILNTGQGT